MPRMKTGLTGHLHGATPLALLEAFCCIQVERIQRTLNSRFGHGNYGPGIRNYLTPQNDHLTRYTLVDNARRGSHDSDTYVTVYGSV